jgi:hypothetical protein
MRRGISRRLESFDHALDTLDENVHAAPFVDKVDRAPVEGHDFVGREGVGSQEHHRQIYAVVPQLGQKIDARRLRERPVDNDDVGIGGGVERAEQRRPIAEALHGESTFRQLVAKNLAVVVVIVDE